MKFFDKTLIFLFASAAIVAGCEHDEDPAGPNLIDRFGPFVVEDSLSASRDTVDFSEGQTLFFTAEFNKNVDWVIKIEGMESGAVKRIEGFAFEINADNATWNGSTTTLPFFKPELCRVVISVPDEPQFTDTLMVEVTGSRIYPGMVFADFETPGGQDIELGNFEFELTPQTGRVEDISAAEGNYYFLMEGTDDVVRNFFVGLINISSSITGETYAPLPTFVPSQLYFNFFIKHDGRPHTIAVIQFAYDGNDNGVYDQDVDPTFQVEGDFPLNHVGWRHFSHRMSATGMSAAQLEKLVAIRVLLISDDNAQPTPPLQVAFGIDYMTFTQGAPLQL